MSTVAQPLSVALWTALTADAGVTALIGQRVYDTTAPSGTPFPYVTIGDTSEGAFNAFGRRGNENAIMLHIWDRSDHPSVRVNKIRVDAVYAELERVLNEMQLPLGGGRTHLRGTTRLVSAHEDENDPQTMHATVRYESLSRS